MNPTTHFEVEALEDHPVTVLARLQDPTTGNLTNVSTVTALTFKVFDLESLTPSVIVASGTINVGDSILNELHIDDRWTVDDMGYNFVHTLSSSIFSTGSRTYDLEYEFSTPGGVNTAFGLPITVHLVSWRTA